MKETIMVKPGENLQPRLSSRFEHSNGPPGKLCKWQPPATPTFSTHHMLSKSNFITVLSLTSMTIVQFPCTPFNDPSYEKSSQFSSWVFVESNVFHCSFLFFLLLMDSASGFGSMATISASFGDYGIFCAIDASGKQAVICWDINNSSSTASSSMQYSVFLPPMVALSGGEGFLCGILANTSQVYCWDSVRSSESSELVPQVFKSNAYSHVAAGKDHVCAIRESYFSENDSGSVGCWDIVRVPNVSASWIDSARFYDQNASILVFRKLVSSDGFGCGLVRDGGIACWGPKSGTLVSDISDNFVTLASGLNSVCGVLQVSGVVKCWGANDSYGSPPLGDRFVSLAAGARHFCGIREDNHGVECWGNFNASLIPNGSGFLAIASSNFLTWY